ncbi:MAG: LysE family transporter [Burkholderiales bacterium]|nr:LysE family transporter [Burkholderiales bacterium]
MYDASSFLQGLVLGLGLFSSVGPKDAFVIERSLTGRYLAMLVLICSGSDALLIALGALGAGAALAGHRMLLTAMTWSGIAYLLWYGAGALRRAWVGRPEGGADAAGAHRSMQSTAMTALVLSLLTPFAWVDTVLVLGPLSVDKGGVARWFFAGGAVVASMIWFCALTQTAFRCRHLFKRAAAWQALDGLIAVLMLCMAGSLAWGQAA